MKTKSYLRYTVLATLCFCLVAPMPAKATFTQASAELRDSNSDGSLAMFYGLLSLLYDSSYLTYYSHIYMDSAQSHALDGYLTANRAYSQNPSHDGYLAQLYAYYDWYYKSQASLSLYYTYLYPSFTYSSQSISDGYLGLYYSSFSAYFTGLASAGGAR